MRPSIFRNKKKTNSKRNEAQERLALAIVSTCLRWQSKYAAWLQNRSERLSGKTKYMLLILFVSLFGSYSFFLVIKGFTVSASASVSIENINHLYTSDKITKSNEAFISKAQYQKIQRFRIYMDSLARSPTGKKYYEHILITRPGLMDSIDLIDSIYIQQIKK